MKVFLATLLIIFTAAMLSLTGFCFSEMRWLSDHEKIEIAVREVLNSGDFSLEYIDTDRTKKIREPRPITYQTPAEFHKANPNCCEIVQVASEGYRSSIIDRITGYASCMVRVKYSVKYISNKGIISSSTPIEVYPTIQNCGIAW